MNSGYCIVVLIAGIFGIKNPLIGSIIGCALTLILSFVIQTFQIETFIKTFLGSIVFGFGISFAAAYIANLIASGCRGRAKHSGSSFFGDGSDSTFFGGNIVLSEDEEKNKKQNETHVP